MGSIDFEKFTDKTIVVEQQLRGILEDVHKRGWGGVDQQFEEGLRSIAVPIRDVNGKVIAALNCSTHAGRVTKEILKQDFLPLLQDCAEKISEAMVVTNNSAY